MIINTYQAHLSEIDDTYSIIYSFDVMIFVFECVHASLLIAYYESNIILPKHLLFVTTMSYLDRQYEHILSKILPYIFVDLSNLPVVAR